MPFNVRKIRAKLMLLTVLSSGVGLLLAGLLIGVSGYRRDYQVLGERAATQAQIMAANSAAAVAFGDAVTAQGILEALRLDTNVISARVRKDDGTTLAHIQFGRPPGRRALDLSAPVMLGEQIGTVDLQVSSAALDASLRSDALILLAVLGGAMGVALLCAAALHRIVSAPYAALARTKEQLEAALGQANAAARAKAEFLANMSHEIRTPMNGVIGMLDLVDVGKLDGESRSMIVTARGAADSLLSIINDVLDFSKIDAGKLTLESIDVDMRALVEDVATIFASQGQAKGVEVTCAIHADVPRLLRSDPTRVRQILVNLVGNAVKFTQHGEVFVGLQPVRGSGAGHRQMYQLLVSDTGIGISDAAIAGLFQAFTQADGSTTRRYGGTGLGLAITKRLIEAFGGSIRVRSAPGQGSTFSVYIPMDPSEHSAIDTPGDLREARVLVVDDNPTNRCVLEHYLSHQGASYSSAASAQEGLEALRQSVRQNEPFDIVLLDYQMPEMDGIGFLRTLRSDPSIAAIRCIVLSSLGDRSSQSADLGIDAWLTKPIRATQLQVTLRSVLSGQLDTAAASSSRESPSSMFPGARVLLVEDNEVNQKVAVRLLGTFGIDPQLVTDGAQAVAALRSQSFDLILMDCQMPVMDGYEATAAIRRFSSIPIVAMTANALAGDRERCIDSGMNDFVAKPVKRETLGLMLDRWLGGAREKTATPLRPVAAMPPASDASLVLDPAVLQPLREIMGSEFSALVRAYLQDVPRQMAGMGEALARGDWTAAEHMAHSIKASSRSLGALALGGIAERLERELRNQSCSAESHPCFAALKSAFEVVSLRLRQLADEAAMPVMCLPETNDSAPRFVKESTYPPTRRRS